MNSPGSLCIALETTPLLRSGAGRGLGRYVGAVREAAGRLGHDVVPVSVATRTGRAAEFVDLVERRRRLHGLAFDVFHATTPYTGAGTSSHTVASILDLIPLDVPSHRRTGMKARWFHRLAARAGVIVTLSEYSATRIAARLRFPEERIVVAPLPPGEVFRDDDDGSDGDVLDRLGLRRPYFISVGDVTAPDPRKRLPWLVGVAEALAGEGHRLVLVGDGTEAVAGVHGVGRVDDATLAALYRRAYALVFTSAYEGQGLPPLEALACGTPVVAMANTSIHDVVGAAGLLVTETAPPQQAAVGPHSPTDAGCRRLAAACTVLAREPLSRQSLADHAGAQVSRFSQARLDAALDHAYRGAQR